MPTSIQPQVPATPAQIGQILNGDILLRSQTTRVIAKIEIAAIKVGILKEKNYNAQPDHGNAGPQSHPAALLSLPSLDFF